MDKAGAVRGGTWRRPCEVCVGEKCGECHDGWINETQRPLDLLTADADELFGAYRWFHEHHQLPVHGGMLDQSQAFFAAVEYIDRARAAYQQERARKQALAEQFKKAHGGKPNRTRR